MKFNTSKAFAGSGIPYAEAVSPLSFHFSPMHNYYRCKKASAHFHDLLHFCIIISCYIKMPQNLVLCGICV